MRHEHWEDVPVYARTGLQYSRNMRLVTAAVAAG